MSVLQGWVEKLSMMQQSVLIAAVRAPDGLRKDHPVKVIMRWYRRSIMVSAMNGKVYDDPFQPGGGSFTGPFILQHVVEMLPAASVPLTIESERDLDRWWTAFAEVQNVYLRHVDEMPHHFQLHLMHAAEIVGYKHPSSVVRCWWRAFYEKIVNDAHLVPESEERMDYRLGDKEEQWRACEDAPAK